MAIRKGDWKLVKAAERQGPGRRRRGGVPAGEGDRRGGELFNLKDDVGEKTDLAAKHPEKVKELAAAWQKWNAELAEPLWGPPTREEEGLTPTASPAGAGQAPCGTGRRVPLVAAKPGPCRSPRAYAPARSVGTLLCRTPWRAADSLTPKGWDRLARAMPGAEDPAPSG